ncbi:MAG: transglycosylase SLT domain-containing protein [Treponema sp.]|nr:transglycosylase SLT domain-containing protein [Treponema sp.]
MSFKRFGVLFFTLIFLVIVPCAAQNSILTREVLEKPLVQHYIRLYASADWRPGLIASMERGAHFLTFIDSEIAEMGMPWELRYLPLIESNFLPTAVSSAGASGLWQFMQNSMTPFDMRIDDWMDERRDFWKSTQGALSKLKENYDFFGDYYLALAAYNMGLGGLNRLIQESGIDDYWVLAESGLLRNETLRYVPRLIAAAYVLTNASYYGIDLDEPIDHRWTRVPVGRSVDLRLLADRTGMDRDKLLMGNQELVYFITPPARNHYIKVPGFYVERITEALERRDITLLEFHYHTIRSGDTLLALSRHYGVTVDQILSANPGVQERYLRLGSSLMIPAIREVEPFIITRRNPGVFTGEHQVQRGDTLWSLSIAYNVDPESLAEANGMGINDILREGIILRTPAR